MLCIVVAPLTLSVPLSVSDAPANVPLTVGALNVGLVASTTLPLPVVVALTGCPLLLLPITVALAGTAPPLISVALLPSIRYQSVPSVYTRPFPPGGIVQAATGEQISVGPPLAIVTVAVPTLFTAVIRPVVIVDGSVPVHPVEQFAR